MCNEPFDYNIKSLTRKETQCFESKHKSVKSKGGGELSYILLECRKCLITL